MKIVKGKLLADLTTFRIGGQTEFFCSVESKEDLPKAVHFAREKKLPIFILGGGSNILISDKGFNGLVIKMEMKGIEESKEQRAKSKDKREIDNHKILISAACRRNPFFSEWSEEKKDYRRQKAVAGMVFIRVSAGEYWDGFVAWTVERGYCGLENLSLIPGTVGAAPVQNIGAYGVEVGDFIESVEVFDIKDDGFKNLSKKECQFSYRDSIFKHEQGRYIITSVLFKLKKNSEPDISYKDLKEYFGKGLGTGDRGLEKTNNSLKFSISNCNCNSQSTNSYNLAPNPSIFDVRKAVIAIRTAKLPDVRKVGTAGSFFKNPIVSSEKYAELKEKYPDLPGFIEPDDRIKISLAWVIDKVCGLKGKKFGKVGIHETQALVIVNHGGATFEEVERMAKEIETAVKEKTGVDIEREVIMV